MQISTFLIQEKNGMAWISTSNVCYVFFIYTLVFYFYLPLNVFSVMCANKYFETPFISSLENTDISICIT